MKLRLLQQVILASCIAEMLFLASMPVMAGYWRSSHPNCEKHGLSFRSYPVNPPDEVEIQEEWPNPGWYVEGPAGLPIDEAGHAWVYMSGTLTSTITWVPDNPNDIPNGNAVIVSFLASADFESDGYPDENVKGYVSMSLPYTRLYDGNGYFMIVAERSRPYLVQQTDNGYEARISVRYHIRVNAENPYDLANAHVYAVAQLGCGDSYSTNIDYVPTYPGDEGGFDPGDPGFDPGDGGGQSGGDPVSLTTGEHLYAPVSDIEAYNPNGPRAVYQRNYLSKKVRAGKKSPGLVVGWADNYDVRITQPTPTEGTPWPSLTLIYPNDLTVPQYPEMDGSTPTGDFTPQMGAPYMVEGTAGTGGYWNSLTVTWKGNETVWTFIPDSSNPCIYRLSKISNKVGKSILINRGIGGRVSSVTDDSTPANTLLTFYYTGDTVNDYLDHITDAYGRKATYTFGTDAGTTCLLSVSQIVSSSTTGTAPTRVTYDYDTVGSFSGPHLIGITVPSPTGTGTSTQHVNYDTTTGKVTSFVDGNGNQRVYTYLTSDSTKVEVKNAQNTVESWYIYHYEALPGTTNVFRGLGKEDASGNRTTLYYEDLCNPFHPTKVEDPNGKETTYEYDQFGSVISITGPRGTTTLIEYDYSDFALGRVAEVGLFNMDEKIFRTLRQYEYTSAGLVNSIKAPKPGVTDGTLLESIFTYDSLGNILTATSPGNNAATTSTTTYNYTTDGSYSQAAKLGQPLTITDNLGHVTHFRYDARGNVISITDAEGNEVNYAYNIAGQPILTILPPSQ
jgi:YD repeat-containing protein